MKAKIFERVTCQSCRDRLEQCPTNEHGFPLTDRVYDVGNMANPEIGHAMFFTRTGRAALCIASERVDD